MLIVRNGSGVMGGHKLRDVVLNLCLDIHELDHAALGPRHAALQPCCADAKALELLLMWELLPHTGSLNCPDLLGVLRWCKSSSILLSLLILSLLWLLTVLLRLCLLLYYYSYDHYYYCYQYYYCETYHCYEYCYCIFATII